MNVNLIDRHVDRILKVVFGENLINLFIVLEEAFKLQTAFSLRICLVLENFAEAGELGFVPELAKCGSGYLYTEYSLSIFVERYLSKQFIYFMIVIILSTIIK